MVAVGGRNRNWSGQEWESMCKTRLAEVQKWSAGTVDVLLGKAQLTSVESFPFEAAPRTCFLRQQGNRMIHEDIAPHCTHGFGRLRDHG